MTKWQPLPLALHSRYFSLNNSYLGIGEFLSEPGGQFVLPVDKAIFLHIMGKAKDWGMTMYEQVRHFGVCGCWRRHACAAASSARRLTDVPGDSPPPLSHGDGGARAARLESA